MTGPQERRSARPIFAGVAVVLVLAVGFVGAIIGGNGAVRSLSMDLGVVSFPMTPVSMALFGMAVATVTLTVFYGLVSLAARYDAEAPGRE